MCTVPLPPAANPMAVKYIISYQGPPPKHNVPEQCADILVARAQVSIWKQEFKTIPIHVGFTRNKNTWNNVSQNYTLFFTFQFTSLSVSLPLLLLIKLKSLKP
jgi:hypothetical protein